MRKKKKPVSLLLPEAFNRSPCHCDGCPNCFAGFWVPCRRWLPYTSTPEKCKECTVSALAKEVV